LEDIALALSLSDLVDGKTSASCEVEP
jgi:hypothetical protein